MAKSPLRVVRYKNSATSKFVVTGLPPEGNVKRPRKFFSTEVAAKAFKQRAELRIKNEGQAAVHMPEQLRVNAVACAEKLKPYGKGIVEVTDQFLACTEKLKPYGKTLADAADHLLGYLQAIQRSCTVSSFIPTFRKNKKDDKASDRYLKDLKNRLERFEQDFGSKLIASIQPHEIEDWVRGLGLAPQTRKNYRTILKTFFGAAVDARYALTNPVAKKRQKITNAEIGVFTPEQMRTVLETAPSDFIPYLVIGAFAGLRAAEIERLDWKHIDLGQKLIEVTATTSKNAQHRNVPITDHLAAWLAPHVKKAGPVADSEKVIVARRKTCADAKIEWPHNVLRHSYGSYHYAHFKNAATLAADMGHSSTKMIFKHYRKMIKPEVAARWWQIAPPADYGNVVAFEKTAS